MLARSTNTVLPLPSCWAEGPCCSSVKTLVTDQPLFPMVSWQSITLLFRSFSPELLPSSTRAASGRRPRRCVPVVPFWSCPTPTTSLTMQTVLQGWASLAPFHGSATRQPVLLLICDICL